MRHRRASMVECALTTWTVSHVPAPPAMRERYAKLVIKLCIFREKKKAQILYMNFGQWIRCWLYSQWVSRDVTPWYIRVMFTTTLLLYHLDINECESSPCQNGGACTDHVNRFTCACAAGYEGTRCQTSKWTANITLFLCMHRRPEGGKLRQLPPPSLEFENDDVIMLCLCKIPYNFRSRIRCSHKIPLN